MTESQAQFTLQVAVEDGDSEEVDSLTRGLLSELLDQPVESADLVTGQAQPGTKGDPVTIGSIALVVLPTFLPKVMETVAAWITRGQGRTVKFKGKINGQTVEFDGSGEEFKALLQTLKPQ
jgi:hypothetical protein